MDVSCVDVGMSDLVFFLTSLLYFKESTHLSRANSVDPDQTPRLAASDLRLQCFFLCPINRTLGIQQSFLNKLCD